MSANVITETQSPKLEELGKQKQLLQLTHDLQRKISAIVGHDVKLDLQITVAENKYQDWMNDYLRDEKVFIAITDDSLPF